MSVIGKVESLWRYPVKSMRGEELHEAFIGFAGVAILLAAIGIYGLVSYWVSQRTFEIGVRVAIGATRREIRLQFLTEAVLISLGGGIIGTILGLAVPFSIRIFTEYRIPISGLSAIIAITVASLVGVIFGTVPATRAAQLDPNDPNWPYHAALARYYVDGDVQGAMTELRAVTQRFPSYPPAQYRLGDFLLDFGDVEGAARAFEQTIAGAPKAADGYVGMGEVLLRKNDLDGAARQLAQAIALEPDYKRAHYMLGRVLQKQGQTERAEQELAVGSDDSKRVMLDPVAEHIGEYRVTPDSPNFRGFCKKCGKDWCYCNDKDKH